MYIDFSERLRFCFDSENARQVEFEWIEPRISIRVKVWTVHLYDGDVEAAVKSARDSNRACRVKWRVLQRNRRAVFRELESELIFVRDDKSDALMCVSDEEYAARFQRAAVRRMRAHERKNPFYWGFSQ
eukprot:TRINITY_DN7487_c0_g1_i1.p2 TRINITY_DN7487_c0_g1~~TRINITY_DN7487_c0_g1_i1.p2  ORF type:complete len:129 (+),score=35.21 TRINITY_DN7487_c0_g1_i1:306-692(+)